MSGGTAQKKLRFQQTVISNVKEKRMYTAGSLPKISFHQG